MKAAVFYEAERIELEDIERPALGPTDVMVQVDAVGICGSDVEYYYGRSPVGTATGKGPLVLGHEFMGRIVELGSAVTGELREGDRVAVNPIQSCNACDACRAGTPQFCTQLSVLGVTTNGAFAEYARTHFAHAYKLPDSLTDEQGAFVEMLAAAVNAVEKAEIRPGQLVLIYGPGPVGLSMVQLARAKGAVVLVAGTRESRLELARQLGAYGTYSIGETGSTEQEVELAEAINSEHGRLPDRVIVSTSSMAANQQALSVAAPGATIVFMAVTPPDAAVSVPMLDSLIADKTIRFSLWYPYQWPRTIALLASGAVDTTPIINTTATLDELPHAIERLVARQDNAVKTVVRAR